MKLHEVMKNELQVGDYIICKGNKVKVAEILAQDFYFCDYSPERSYIDIEFTDSKGKYRHWKSNLDGGTLEYAGNKDISSLRLCSSFVDNIPAISSDLKALVRLRLQVGCTLCELAIEVNDHYDSPTVSSICRSLSNSVLDYLKDWNEYLLVSKGMTVGEVENVLSKKEYPEDLICQSLVKFLNVQILV